VLTPYDLIALLPLLVLTAAATALMVSIAFVRRHGAVLAMALVGLAATLASLPIAAISDEPQVTALLRVDEYALFFIGLLTVATGAVALLAYEYMEGREKEPPEFYLLLLIALLGAATMTAATHFATFFLGLEILSVSLYTLIAYPRLRLGYIEASVKYLILAGTTSAFLLFGMALVYVESGVLTVSGLATVLNEGAVEVSQQLVNPNMLVVVGGLALMLVSIGFKLAVVPFHMWTPDIYQGAPAPVTAFIATVSKGATVALLLRFFSGVDMSVVPALFWMFALIAGASMVVGNLLALLQNNIKRLLAYSSIAHLGYMLVAFLAAGELAVIAVSFYVVVYFITNLIAFGVVSVLTGEDREAEDIADYRGLAARRPWLAGALAAALFSLAGLPLTAGFIGKFYLVRAGAGEALWALIIILVLTSALSLYYYARVIVAMYVQRPAVEGAEVETTEREGAVRVGAEAEAAEREAVRVGAGPAEPGRAGAVSEGAGAELPPAEVTTVGVAAAPLPSGFEGPAETGATPVKPVLDSRPAGWRAGLVLTVAAILLFVLGVYPAPLVRLVERVAGTLP
jgi:NADH-quinone oxidoreductase subunit N